MSEKMHRLLALFTVCLWMLNLHAEEQDQSAKVKLSRREKREFNFIQWHYSHRETFRNNKKYMDRLKKKFSDNKISGLELVIAAPTDIRIESKWGHSLMRFVDNDGEAGDDIVLGFVAILDTPFTGHLKGLLGMYPVFPVVKTLRLFNTQYVKQEDRPLDRYPLVTSQEGRTQMIEKTLSIWNHFQQMDAKLYQNALTQYKRKAQKRADKRWGKNNWEMTEIEHPESGEVVGFTVSSLENEEEMETIAVRYQPAGHPELGGYTFLSNNCAGALVRFSKVVGLPNRGGLGLAGRIPVKLPVYYEKSLLSLYPAYHGIGLAELKKSLSKLLGMKKLELLADEKSWPKESAEKIMATYTLVDVMRIIDGLDDLVPDPIREQLINQMPPIDQRPNYDQIYNLLSLPQELYEQCQDQACIARLNEKAETLWSKGQLTEKRTRLTKIMNKMSLKEINEVVRDDQDHLQHLKLWTMYPKK